MLDRLSVELLHAQAKNSFAIPALQEAAQELLACVGVWLASNDPDELPMSAQVAASEMEPHTLAQMLRDLAEHLLVWAAIADVRHGNAQQMTDLLHPLHLANALDVLCVELGKELKGDDAQQALSLLRLELGFAAGQGQAWAADHDLDFDYAKPGPACDAEECLRLMPRLADALRDLASREAVARNDNGSF